MINFHIIRILINAQSTTSLALIRGKTHIMQLINLCDVNSRKCGSDVTWPERGQRPTSGQVTQSHRSMVLISCYWHLHATGLLENSQILIWKSILINRGLNPWSLTVMSSKLWMSVLICTIFTTSNVCVCLCFFECCGLRWIKIVIQKSTLIKFNKQKKKLSHVKLSIKNHRSRDPKQPIGNAY